MEAEETEGVSLSDRRRFVEREGARGLSVEEMVSGVWILNVGATRRSWRGQVSLQKGCRVLWCLLRSPFRTEV